MAQRDREIKAVIRAKLGSSELPSAKPEKVWAGAATNKPCGACGTFITADDVEYEVDFAGARAAMRLHRRCIMLWDKLRHELSPTRGRDANPDVA